MRDKASQYQPFFLPGDCKDPTYRNVRDHPNLIEAKAFVESLWSRYYDLADPHSSTNAQNDFLPRFWEMYLAVTLRERGFQLKRVGDKGPEFYFEYDGGKVWVEAVAPGPGSGVDRLAVKNYAEFEGWSDEKNHLHFMNELNNEPKEVPVEKILLRYTNALDTEKDNYLEARNKGIINPEDLYLLAINSQGIPHASWFRKPMPYFVQAFLPFGPLTAWINPEGRGIDRTFYQRRENVIKENESPVPTTAFLNPDFSFVSAVIHSGVDCANHPESLGGDFIILHNPTATHPVDPTMFHWVAHQIFYQNGQLEFRPELK